jgi:hypothetical protein
LLVLLLLLPQLAVNCRVEALSFSAHADFEQTSGFLDELQPPHVVLVHGERNQMDSLRRVSQLGLRVFRCRLAALQSSGGLAHRGARDEGVFCVVLCSSMFDRTRLSHCLPAAVRCCRKRCMLRCALCPVLCAAPCCAHSILNSLRHTVCCALAPVACALQALERSAERNRWQRTLYMPENAHGIEIPFKPRHVATVRGRLADVPAKAGEVLRGVLVAQQGQDQVMHPNELSTFTKLTAGGLECRVLSSRALWC